MDFSLLLGLERDEVVGLDGVDNQLLTTNDNDKPSIYVQKSLSINTADYRNNNSL